MSDASEQSSEKSLPPSEQRLAKAREKGEIPLSADLVAAFAFTGLVLALLSMGTTALNNFGSALSRILVEAAGESSVEDLMGKPALYESAIGSSLRAVASIFLLPALAASLTLLAQSAPRIAADNLRFKISRISLSSGFKRIFSISGLAQFLRSLFKLCLVSIVLVLFIISISQDLIAISAVGVGQGVHFLFVETLVFLSWVSVLLIAVAIIDLLIQRQIFMRRHRMSYKDLRDEVKENEGDPELKQQRRARAVAIATSPLRKIVSDATVVIVNPRHYAVVLAWDPARDAAPQCVAKGVDEIAAKIRQFAREAGVPIYRDPATARRLFAELQTGMIIERHHFKAVAAAVRFAQKLRTPA